MDVIISFNYTLKTITCNRIRDVEELEYRLGKSIHITTTDRQHLDLSNEYSGTYTQIVPKKKKNYKNISLLAYVDSSSRDYEVPAMNIDYSLRELEDYAEYEEERWEMYRRMRRIDAGHLPNNSALNPITFAQIIESQDIDDWYASEDRLKHSKNLTELLILRNMVNKGGLANDEKKLKAIKILDKLIIKRKEKLPNVKYPSVWDKTLVGSDWDGEYQLG